MRLQFEDAHTIRYQVQEVLHLEKAADPRVVRQELDTYAHLLPDGTQWKASLLIELPNAAERAREMPMLNEAAHRLYVQVRGQACVFASANEDQPDRHCSRPSGVHFLCFQLPRTACVQLLAGAAVAIGCAHPDYPWRVLVPAATLARLRLDLAPAALLRERDRPGPVRRPDRRGEDAGTDLRTQADARTHADARKHADARFHAGLAECDECGALRLVRPLGDAGGALCRELRDEAADLEIERILADANVYRWRPDAPLTEASITPPEFAERPAARLPATETQGAAAGTRAACIAARSMSTNGP